MRKPCLLSGPLLHASSFMTKQNQKRDRVLCQSPRTHHRCLGQDRRVQESVGG
uniref:Uncharacterized protein n=1 Tax=Arundo donax TaxID=35708 RepID=A0A0A9H906_ARUDO